MLAAVAAGPRRRPMGLAMLALGRVLADDGVAARLEKQYG